ncbi:sensor histidine kinase [Microbispora sp. ATCC PTA-5024]|uniref:sensor histidine kinase n=1 Tax=Microbispora sp. ATCC PTA-5024 TaxID=316330 RepID=UPI0018DC9A74|nr:histidine kinase [Microbispora sp. ATCC PTA-5024]
MLILILATGLAGSVLLVLHPALAVFWFTFWACVGAGADFPSRTGGVVVICCCCVLLVGYLDHRGDALAGYAAVAFVAYLLGHNRKLYVDMAQQALRAADDRARAATLTERTRIARELHDVLAHSLTSLSLQVEAASAALETTGDQERALSHLEHAGRLVRSGQEEAVAAVRALREGDVAALAMVERLVGAFREAGGQVTLRVTGPVPTLPASHGMAVYRLVQEALTNAAKHAPGAPVDVHLSFTGDGFAVSVTNDAAADTAAPVSGGNGLAGMRERITAAGGTLTAGRVGAQWRVHAWVGA